MQKVPCAQMNRDQQCIVFQSLALPVVLSVNRSSGGSIHSSYGIVASRPRRALERNRSYLRCTGNEKMVSSDPRDPPNESKSMRRIHIFALDSTKESRKKEIKLEVGSGTPKQDLGYVCPDPRLHVSSRASMLLLLFEIWGGRRAVEGRRWRPIPRSGGGMAGTSGQWGKLVFYPEIKQPWLMYPNLIVNWLNN